MDNIINTTNLKLFIFINSHHNQFWDEIMYIISGTAVWIPLDLYVLYTLYKEFKKKSWIYILAVLITLAISDKVSTYFKYLMKTLRPSHEDYLKPIIHLSKSGPGGLYGYVSSHASNFFSVTMFMCIVLPKKYNWLKVILIISAVFVSYSRIYNGVHYPLDVIRGILLGSSIGLLVALILKQNKFTSVKELVK